MFFAVLIVVSKLVTLSSNVKAQSSNKAQSLKPKKFGFCRSLKPLILTTFFFLLIVLPWHYVMFRCHGRSFVDEYFFYHILKRASQGIEQHGRPFWWFNIVIRHWARYWYVLGSVSFAALVAFLARNVRRLKRFQAELLVFLWIGLTFLVFSLSSSKIQWYIIPIYPPLALVCGWFMSKVEEWFLEFKRSDFQFSIFKKFGNCLPRGISKKFFRGLLKIVNSAGLIGRLEFTTLATLFAITVGVTGLMLNQRKWFPEDLNRDLAFLSNRARKLKKVGGKLYVADAPPGLPIFYSGKKVVTVSRGGALQAMGKRGAVLLSKKGTYEVVLLELRSEGKEVPRVFAISGDYILFGK